jgi:hypothetical protein
MVVAAGGTGVVGGCDATEHSDRTGLPFADVQDAAVRRFGDAGVERVVFDVRGCARLRVDDREVAALRRVVVFDGGGLVVVVAL